jgi:hypothetical protein
VTPSHAKAEDDAEQKNDISARARGHAARAVYQPRASCHRLSQDGHRHSKIKNVSADTKTSKVKTRLIPMAAIPLNAITLKQISDDATSKLL